MITPEQYRVLKQMIEAYEKQNAINGKEQSTEADVFTITGIEDVFKRQGKDYAAFCAALNNAGVTKVSLNHQLLEIGIAYLNQGWEWQTGKDSYINYWDMRGSGFVLGGDGCNDGVNYTTVGPALRLENSKKAQFAAEVFYPQYNGYYKPDTP